MPLDTSIASLVPDTRGADTASSMLMSKSMLLRSTWVTPIAIWVPPGAPTMYRSSSPSNPRVGQRLLKRLLPGANESACPGRGSNTAMQPLNMKPRPSVITPGGMPSEWVIDTALPSRSTTHTWVVSLGS